MSLCSSYVKCQDGKWYKELCYVAEDYSWFICFDDRDPVEVVIKDSCPLSAKQICDLVGIPYRSVGRPCGCGSRCFENRRFYPARSVFINVENRPFPSPRPSDHFDEVFDECPSREGCFYGMTDEDLNKTWGRR